MTKEDMFEVLDSMEPEVAYRCNEIAAEVSMFPFKCAFILKKLVEKGLVIRGKLIVEDSFVFIKK